MYYGTPPIVTNGLVLNLDPANSLSIPVDPTVNLKTDSQNFTGSGYVIETVTVTGSFLAPDGTNTATLVREDTSNSIHRIYYTPPTSTATLPISGAYYTVSFYVKPEGRFRGASFWEWPSGRVGVIYNLNTMTLTPYLTLSGSLFASSIETAPNGYYRISYTARDTASYNNTVHTFFRLADDAGNLTYTGNGTSGSYIWGLQVEQNTYATPYIQSTSTLGRRTTWRDISGNNNVAILTTSSISSSIPQYSSLNSRVLNFDGTGSYASIPSMSFNPVGNSDFTISTWIKLNAKPLSNPRIISLGSDANNYFNLGTYGGNSPGTYDTFWFEIKKAGTFYGGFFDSSRKYETNTWYNLVGTSINSTNSMSFYINGISVTGGQVIGGAPNTFNTMFIGTNTTSSFEVINGSITQIQVYNRALSQAEVTQNYNAYKSRYGLT